MRACKRPAWSPSGGTGCKDPGREVKTRDGVSKTGVGKLARRARRQDGQLTRLVTPARWQNGKTAKRQDEVFHGDGRVVIVSFFSVPFKLAQFTLRGRVTVSHLYNSRFTKNDKTTRQQDKNLARRQDETRRQDGKTRTWHIPWEWSSGFIMSSAFRTAIRNLHAYDVSRLYRMCITYY
ncbi:hypothetical protein BC936DRAFT_139446 [Jimgerdemannia flammicorona]|uniref:Uncharacterized protein n=1 Tax=Jimgerdemannia flammicorona TaxID=994334 RepID=A0A433B9W3_9FUNG|nr:hypothetical protein BC936DRAFT_139446 [Jimgerdemannia flammicorona]